MPPVQIVVSVRRGCVQNVFCSDPTAQLTVVDWDVDGSRPSVPERVRFEGEDGYCSADVSHPYVESLASLEKTDVARALQADRRRRSRSKPKPAR